jgi:uncharacterized phage-associated protein
MPFDSKHVTNCLIQRSFKEGRADMSPMKAQKMLFFTHGWHLAITGEPAINEPFEVWPYGPVVSTIYKELSKFGGNKITDYIKEYDAHSKEQKAYVVNSANAKFYEIFDIVWEKYIGITAIRLSAMTHEPNSPWDEAKKRHQSIIPDSTIKEYFIGLAAR